MEDVLKDFIKFVSEKLRIDELPDLKIADPGFSKHHKTFGVYFPDAASFTVEVHDRNIVDVLRTVAHELVHHRQMEVNSSKSRTDLEIEATAAAGMLVKLYCENHPDLYKHKI
jgi:hypothetical protein